MKTVANSLVKIFTRSRRDIAARFWPPRFPHLAAISAPRRDCGVILTRDRGEITARYGKSRRPKTRRDLAAIVAEMREISAAKNAPRSRRDSRREWKSRRANTRRDVAARSQRDREISVAKTRRDREVISRRDMEISAGSFAARSRWES